MIVRDQFDNGLCLITETMPDFRSVSLGVWLTRGSRHEDRLHAGIAHFVEHMLFKGTATRTAEDIAQQVDSIGGQLDAFTAKECTGYYVKVLDEHLPRAVELLADILQRPAFDDTDIGREKKVILEEIKMVEDIPDDLVHEIFTANFWAGHPLSRPILGSRESVKGITSGTLRDFFGSVYVARNLVISVAGNLEHRAIQDLIGKAFEGLPIDGPPITVTPPTSQPRLLLRDKELEQSHVCLGMQGYPQDHADRYVAYVLNTVLGGSMSSRLFQNVREKRALAYSVSSSLVAYRDTGVVMVYAGCDTAAVGEVVRLVVAEMRNLKTVPIPEAELQRAKDHLKGNLVLGLESTTSRMSELARSEICFGRQIDLVEHLAAIDRVTAADTQRVAADLFTNGSLAATVLGPVDGLALPEEQLALD